MQTAHCEPWAIKPQKWTMYVCVFVWNIKRRWGHNNSIILNFIDLFYSRGCSIYVFMHTIARNQQPVKFIVNAPYSMTGWLDIFQYLASSIFIIIYDMLIPMSIIQF